MTTENSNVEHECNLLNRHELSRSQQYELQRFIDQNSYLLRSSSSQGDSSTWTEDKTAERHSRYHNSYRTSPPSSNRGRKEVKWSDSVHPVAVHRTRSLSPSRSRPSNYLKHSTDSSFDDFHNLYNKSYSNNNTSSSNTMSHYGSAGYLNRDRDNQFRTYSPSTNYQAYGRHPSLQDDYNRYETARSRNRMSQRQREEEERSRFSGYGDRPGSGVEFMPTKWHGGEIITDPGHLPRSLKPRRLYYSPIGDGVVAADGVELKRAPKDLSPRISVTHTRTVDRGEPGQDGYNIYSRTLTHEPGSDYGSDLCGSGRDSRLTGGFSPGSDSYGHSGVGPGMSYCVREPDYRGGAERPGSGGGYGSGSGTAGGGAGTGGAAIPLGYGGKDYPDGVGDGGYAGDRGGYFDGTRRRGTADGYGAGSRGADSYVAGPRGADNYIAGPRGADGYSAPRGADGYGTGSPHYSYHSPNAPYHYSQAYHDPHSMLGSARSDPFAYDYRVKGRSQSADPLSGPDSCGDYGFRNDGRSSAGSGFYGASSERSRKFDVTKDYLITNPRELIHQYATTTPVAVLEIPETSRTVKKIYSSTTEEKYVPYPPYKGSEAAIHPNNFTRQLRDEGLTVSQREANRHQNPLTNDDPQTMQKISEIRQQTSRTAPSVKEIDYLTEKMMYGLQSGHPTPAQY